MARPRLRDDDGNWVTAGDTIKFCYGIPPLVALARVVIRKGRLVIRTIGDHKPHIMPLRALRQHYLIDWYKVEAAR